MSGATQGACLVAPHFWPGRGRGLRVRWTPDMLADLRAGCEARWPMARTAARINVSENTCRDKAREMGWLPPRKPREADGA